MSGHSHWAAKLGGGDTASNSALRMAVDKAKEARMTKESIDKAINKGLGIGADGANYEDVIYEGYGPEGVAFYIKGLTDNKNRTVSEIRSIFSKHGGSLGSAGSTAYIFSSDLENLGFYIDITNDSTKEILIKLVEELEDSDDVQEVYTNFR